MEELLIAIQQRIAENMPELKLVEENWGQLENEGEVYPVNFPCVLIDSQSTEWENLGRGSQRGKCIISIRLAVDCATGPENDTAGNEGISERQQMYTRLHWLLQLFKFADSTTPMVRKKSTSYNRARAIKVYESSYEVIINDMFTL